MSRTLITGFGPFQGVVENPSALLAESAGNPHQILAVSYAAVDRFIAEFDVRSYNNLLLMGVARGRAQVNFEFVARNLTSGKDVTGTSLDGLIEVDGPDQLDSTM